jgi:dihydrofolate reductase
MAASVQYYAAASLDGFLARPDGSIDWLQTYGAEADLGDGPMADGSMDEFYGGVGALVMGSATYEWVLEHAERWPYDLPTWVFTSRDLPQPSGAEVSFASGDAAAVREAAMKAAGGKNVWLVGGGNLASQWADEALIDEIIVTFVPVFIGEGLPYFAQAVDGELRHLSTKTHGNGMVELTYRMPQ